MKNVANVCLLLAVSAWGQNAVERQGQTVTLGAGYMSSTKLVKSGSTVTAGHAVKIDASTPGNQVVECALSDVEFLGVAASTVTGDGIATVEVALRGTVAAVPENNTTIGHIAGIGTTATGQLRDLGQVSSSQVGVGTKIVGKWLQAITADGTSTASLQLYGPGHFGAQLQAANVPATPISAGTSVTLSAPRQYYRCSNTCTVTPPAPVDNAAYEFCVFDDAGVTAAITLAGVTSVYYGKPDHSGWAATAGHTLTSTAGTWSKACIIGVDATHYLVVGTEGAWTAN